MAVDKLVDSTQLDSDLTDVADEIRTAGGTLLPLSFPDDYVVAIGDIGNTEIKTASGSIAHFEDALARKAQDLTVAIEPVQDLHGYDNPWPAGGWVNLLPPHSLSSVTNQGVTLTNNNGEYTLNGTTGSMVAVFDVNVNLPAGQYTVAVNNPTANSKVQIYGIDENVAVPLQVVCSTANTTATATFAATVKIFRIRVLADGTVNNFKLSPVFSAGATAATQFYPYENICPISGWTGANVYVSPTTNAADGTTYSISFPSEAGTVYGGTLDVTTGKLTVTHWEIDMGSVAYTESTREKRFSAFFPAGKNLQMWESQNAPSGMLICSKYKEKSYNEVWLNGQNAICVYYAIGGMKFGVCEPTSQNAEDFRQAVTGQTIVYKLATPIVYNLTPTEVTTLLGTNNVWGDTGDSTIQYIAPKAQIPSAQGVYF